jgi:transcriptional regulator
VTPLPNVRGELLPGTLDMLVLRTLSVQSLHGYAIAQHIERLSREVLRVEQGSLYPALERLQRQGWITSRWKTTPTGRRARYYAITSGGRARLQEKATAYARLTAAIARVMGRA